MWSINMKVSDIMSREIFTVDKETTVRDALDRMNEKDVGSLLVEEQGTTIGIITTFDVLNLIGKGTMENDILVEEVMTPRLLVIKQDVDVEEAAKKLSEANIWRLPVVEEKEEGKEIIGMLSAEDILESY